MRPCCVTASVSSALALRARVSRKQVVAVGHLLKRELFGSFCRVAVAVREGREQRRSEVSVPSDKTAAHEALDFVGSL